MLEAGDFLKLIGKMITVSNYNATIFTKSFRLNEILEVWRTLSLAAFAQEIPRAQTDECVRNGPSRSKVGKVAT